MLGRESTSIQSAQKSQSSDTTGNSIVTSEANIFCKLPSSELLKHLLAANQRSSLYCTRTRQDESCKEQSGVSQNTSDAVSSTVIQCDDGVYAVCNQYASSTYSNITQIVQNGSMEMGIAEAEDRNKQASVHQQDSGSVLFNEDLCNSSAAAVEDDDLPVLLYDDFNKQTLNDILAEAEKVLCIEPPLDNANEYCTLQPVDASKHEAAQDTSKRCSISKNVFLCCSVEIEANSEDSENDKANKDYVSNSAGDSSVEKAMVLVPAGKYFSVHIKTLFEISITVEFCRSI